MTAVEEGYSKEIFYHNSLHAADVAISVLFLVKNGLEKCDSLLDVDIFALMIGALCHDISHPGVTNGFLISSQDPLSIKYNDISVLENMHTFKTFQILSAKNTNILLNLSKPDYQRFRKIVVNVIIGSDLSLHFDKITEFKTLFENNLNFSDDKFKILALQMCLKCADLGHGAKSLNIHKR